MAFEVGIEFLWGLTFGIEHCAGDEEDFFEWIVPVHLGFFRIIFIKHKPQ